MSLSCAHSAAASPLTRFTKGTFVADTATRAVDSNDTQTKAKTRRSGLLSLLAIIVLLGAVAYGAYYFTYASRFVSTDNAYVGAETATVTPLINAPVARVLVRETQNV